MLERASYRGLASTGRTWGQTGLPRERLQTRCACMRLGGRASMPERQTHDGMTACLKGATRAAEVVQPGQQALTFWHWRLQNHSLRQRAQRSRPSVSPQFTARMCQRDGAQASGAGWRDRRVLAGWSRTALVLLHAARRSRGARDQ